MSLQTVETLEPIDIRTSANSRVTLQPIVGTGPQGTPGTAATVEVDSTVTEAPGTPASVDNIGDDTAAVLVFHIPEGVPGEVSQAELDAAIAAEETARNAAIAAALAALDAFTYQGTIDCSSNPNYPAASQGHTYKVSVAGKIGGASGSNVEVGDLLICLTDSAAGTQAAVGANWDIIQVNIDGAVIGPAASVNGRLAVFSGTTGKVIADGGTLLADLLTTAAAPELIRDTINTALAQGANITITKDDAGDTTTIAVTGAALSTRGGVEDQFTFSGTTGTVTADASTGSWGRVAPTGDITLAFINLPASGKGCSLTVFVDHPAGTIRTVNPPTGTIHGAIPVMQASATARIDLFTGDGGASWDITGAVLA